MSSNVDKKIEDMISLCKEDRIHDLTHKYFVGQSIPTVSTLYKRLTSKDPDKSMTQIEICQVVLDTVREIASKSK